MQHVAEQRDVERAVGIRNSLAVELAVLAPARILAEPGRQPVDVDATPIRARRPSVHRLGERHIAAPDVEAARPALRHQRLDVQRDALCEHVDSMAVRQRAMQAHESHLRHILVFERDRRAHESFSRRRSSRSPRRFNTLSKQVPKMSCRPTMSAVPAGKTMRNVSVGSRLPNDCWPHEPTAASAAMRPIANMAPPVSRPRSKVQNRRSDSTSGSRGKTCKSAATARAKNEKKIASKPQTIAATLNASVLTSSSTPSTARDCGSSHSIDENPAANSSSPG